MTSPRQIIYPLRKRRPFISFAKTRTLYFEVEYDTAEHGGVHIADFAESIHTPYPGIIEVYSQDGEDIVAIRYLDREVTEEEIIGWVKEAFT